MRARFQRLLMVTLFLLLAACGSEMNSPEQKGRPSGAAVPAGELGSILPDFKIRDITGREVSSSAWRGKVVLVDFWASWCQPCKVEMPGYQELQDRYGPRGLIVIGIALDTNSAAVAGFAKKLGVRYVLVLNSPELQQKFGGILGLPTTMLFDRNGVLRDKVIGFQYKDKAESAVRALL